MSASTTDPTTAAAGTLRVVFVCTHNSARSQMAEGLLRHDFGGQRAIEAYSAGVVARGVHPQAHLALQAVGVDSRLQTSKTIEDLCAQLMASGATEPVFDVVVTVCDNAREACPYLPARLLNLHASFTDPSAGDGTPEQMAAAFAEIRDQIRDWLSGAVPEWLELQSG